MINKIIIALLILMLFACKNKALKQFEYAGGTFKIAIDATITAYQPYQVYDFYSEIVLNQLFEGLVSMDEENLQIHPQLAKSYKISRDGLQYEFKLRDDVYFHPHPIFKSLEDRKLTAEDVIYTFQQICKKNDSTQVSAAYTSLFENKVIGAKLFHEGKRDSITGISSDKNIIKITLITPDASFLAKLASINAAIISKKVNEANAQTSLIGTGPFCFSNQTEGELATINLIKNPDYYQLDAQGFKLPYLNEIQYFIQPNKNKQLALFEEQKIDFILSLPAEGLQRILEDRIQDFNAIPPLLSLRSNPLLATHYYFFNMTEERFRDVRVRQAINYAIDRQKIAQSTLHNQVQKTNVFGIIPPLKNYFKNYNFELIAQHAYTFQPERAKKLWKDAGYNEKKSFGNITLVINEGDMNVTVAKEIATQLKETLNLQVDIQIEKYETFNQRADLAKGDLFRSAWFADYVSPESFLQNFYSQNIPASIDIPSPNNQARYVNVLFDQHFENARHEKKISNQISSFNLAEAELMKNPPLIVLWYAEDNQVVYSYIRNLKENPINYFNFKEVYLLKASKEEYHQ